MTLSNGSKGPKSNIWGLNLSSREEIRDVITENYKNITGDRPFSQKLYLGDMLYIHLIDSDVGPLNMTDSGVFDLGNDTSAHVLKESYLEMTRRLEVGNNKIYISYDTDKGEKQYLEVCFKSVHDPQSYNADVETGTDIYKARTAVLL